MLKVLIWGTGSGAHRYLNNRSEMLDYIDILAFVDGTKKEDDNESFMLPNQIQKNMIPPKRISEYPYDYIVVLSSYYEEIEKSAKEYGISTAKLILGMDFYKLWISEGYKEFKNEYSMWIKKKEYLVEEEESDYIWVAWLQGYKNAPILVKKCIDSIRKHAGNRKLKFITLDNYKLYVEMPDTIVEKFESGSMCAAHFTDILRLMLLEKFGGLWIDATVYCLGSIESVYKHNDFFTFRIKDPSNAKIATNWILYSKKGNIFVRETLELILQYWNQENRIKHYYLMHYFFRMVTECYSKEWVQVPYMDVSNCYLLMHSINEEYSDEKMREIAEIMPIQKLNRRQWIDEGKEHSFYHHIISEVVI